MVTCSFEKPPFQQEREKNSEGGRWFPFFFHCAKTMKVFLVADSRQTDLAISSDISNG